MDPYAIIETGGKQYRVRQGDKLTVEKLETWTSPETGREYGIHWRLQETGKDIDLELEARFPEQEVTGNIITFWEGALEVSGTLEGEAVSGVGYAELVCAYE